jgi:hypothetical protein
MAVLVSAGRPLDGMPDALQQDMVELLGTPKKALKNEDPYQNSSVIRQDI